MNLTCQVQTQVPNFYFSFAISTETALLKVYNDILLNMDNQRVTLLVHTYTPPGVGVLPYMGYIGMCRREGYGFQAVHSGIGCTNQRV